MENYKLQLSTDLRNALLEKDDIAVKTLRSLISALDNAEAVAVKAPNSLPVTATFAGATQGLGSTEAIRRELSLADIGEIIQKEIDELEETAKILSARSLNTEQYTQQINILKRLKDRL